jgi:metal-dependent amidase/aminoacylase/carboxypeptidase family protein
MKYLSETSDLAVRKIASEEKLRLQIEWVEDFPATVNSALCVNSVRDAAKGHNLKEVEVQKPFKWSEDFGHFTKSFNGAFFGLGSGIHTPKLHNPDYDFPDEIVTTGIKMFYSIIDHYLNR